MPDEVNSVVGSFCGTSGELGILLCPFFSKNAIYLLRISPAVIPHLLYHPAWLFATNFAILQPMANRFERGCPPEGEDRDLLEVHREALGQR